MSNAVSSPVNPIEVARETIRQLATKRISPTPENYARIYAEIAGEPWLHPAAQTLECAVAEMARFSMTGSNGAQGLTQALKRQKWEEVSTILQRLVASAASAETMAWHTLVRDLLKQWEIRHDGLPPGRKREALEHVLENSRGEPAKLYLRLGALIKCSIA